MSVYPFNAYSGKNRPNTSDDTFQAKSKLVNYLVKMLIGAFPTILSPLHVKTYSISKFLAKMLKIQTTISGGTPKHQ